MPRPAAAAFVLTLVDHWSPVRQRESPSDQDAGTIGRTHPQCLWCTAPWYGNPRASSDTIQARTVATPLRARPCSEVTASASFSVKRSSSSVHVSFRQSDAGILHSRCGGLLCRAIWSHAGVRGAGQGVFTGEARFAARGERASRYGRMPTVAGVTTSIEEACYDRAHDHRARRGARAMVAPA
jgi:hypothetical protein